MSAKWERNCRFEIDSSRTYLCSAMHFNKNPFKECYDAKYYSALACIIIL